MAKLLETYYRFALSHVSLIIIGLGSGTIFLCNIVFESLLSDVDYGEYSLLITYIGTVFNLAFLGLDKVFLRLSKHQDNAITINRSLSVYFFIIGLIVIIGGSYAYSYHFALTTGILIKVSIISAAMVVSMFVYNVFRLQLQFVKSQLTLNSWKFILGLLAIVFLINKWDDLQLIFTVITVISAICILVFIYILFKTSFKITREETSNDILKYWGSFAVTIVLYVTMAYIDRYYVNENFGPEVFGNYFYLANIYLFPFHLLQNYVGFKKLVFFKNFYNWKFFKKQCVKVVGQAILLAIAVFVAAFVFKYLGFIKVDIQNNLMLIILFLILGILKAYYTLGESALNARISIELFNKVNVISLIITICTLVIAFYMAETIEHIAIAMCTLWIAISIVYTAATRRLQDDRNIE